MVYEKKSALSLSENSSNRILKQQEKVHTPLLSVPIGSRNSNIYQLHKYIGNQRVRESIVGRDMDHHVASNSPTHSLMTLQRVEEENEEPMELDKNWGLNKYTSLNIYLPEDPTPQQQTLFKTHKKAICTYIDKVQEAVNEARELVATLMFVHVPPVDGYMQALLENFNINEVIFREPKRVKRQAGYWIESYATKIVTIEKPEGLEVIHQASRTGTRPDIIIKSTGESSIDIVWLDITSKGQHEHIFWGKRSKQNEDSDEVKGWRNHFTKEIFYENLPDNFTNDKKVPTKDQDLDKLIQASQELQRKNQEKEDSLVAKYSESLFKISQSINAMVRKEISDRNWDDHDLIADIHSGRNLHFLVTRSVFQSLSGQKNLKREEIGSFVLAWNHMVNRNKKLKPINAEYLGVASSGGSRSDGYIYVDDWLNSEESQEQINNLRTEITDEGTQSQEESTFLLNWFNASINSILEKETAKVTLLNDISNDTDQSLNESYQDSQILDDDPDFKIFGEFGEFLKFVDEQIRNVVGYKLEEAKNEGELKEKDYSDLGDPTKKGNLYFQTSKRFFEYLSGQTSIDDYSIASFILAWNTIRESYNRIKNEKIGLLYARHLGVASVKGRTKGQKTKDGYDYVDSWLNIKKIPETSSVSEKIKEFVNDEFEKLKKNDFESEEVEDDNNSSGYVENNSESSSSEGDYYSDEES